MELSAVQDDGFACRRVFLHGWGQAPSLWHRTQLALREDDILLPLPGHGGSEDVATGGWLAWIAENLPQQPVHLVGWSLGAMLALQLAQRLPQQVAALTLYAATPCFLCKDDWPHGVAPAQLDAMAQSVSHADRAQGLVRLTRMMLHGEVDDRAVLRDFSLRQVAAMPLPTATGLEAGLELLRTLDLRPLIADIPQPVHLLHGKRDVVVPCAAGMWLQGHLSNASGAWLADYGHMPWRKTFP